VARYQLTCADCGDTNHEVSRKDARYCPSCKLLRTLVYVTGRWKRPRKCRTCDTAFKPVGPRDLRHCGTCSAGYQSTSSGSCSFCHTGDAALLHPSIAVCLGCLKDPEVQPRVVAALQRGQLERRAAHPNHSHAIVRLP
jgi:hypothetical protein